MTHVYNRIEDDRNISEAESQWTSSIDFGRSSTTHRLIEALLSEYDRIDEDLEDIYEQQHIESATGDDLDQFGNLVDVDRKSGEGDEKYRARIKASFIASIISATWDEYAQFTASVLGVGVDSIGLSTNYAVKPATVNVTVPVAIYDDLSITVSEIKDILSSGVPAGHSINILERGTFRLKQDGDTDDPSKGLTSDSTSDGGTLAADIV